MASIALPERTAHATAPGPPLKSPRGRELSPYSQRLANSRGTVFVPPADGPGEEERRRIEEREWVGLPELSGSNTLPLGRGKSDHSDL